MAKWFSFIFTHDTLKALQGIADYHIFIPFWLRFLIIIKNGLKNQAVDFLLSICYNKTKGGILCQVILWI